MNKPINTDYEISVLGGMMNNNDCYYDSVAQLTEDHFTDEMTRKVFNKLVNGDSRKSANMLIKSTDDPKEKSTIRVLDGAWKNVDEFNFSLKGLKHTYDKRQLFHILNKAQNRFDDSNVEELTGSILDEISNLYEGDGDSENIVVAAERAPQALAEFWDRMNNPNLAKGLPYSIIKDKGLDMGFPSLDEAFYGAHGGDLIMIAAQTGKGKTGFAINLARLFSIYQEYHGYYMNTEMRIHEMEARLLAPVANVKANEIFRGKLEGNQTEREAKEKRISEAFNSYMKSNIYLSRIPDLPLHKAQGLANQIKNKYKRLDYLVVDYVGRMEIAGFQGNTWDELYHITKTLKELAMRLDIPIFMLAQRNQAGDVEGAKKMMNECDGVLYLEPTSDDDLNYIEQNVMREYQNLVNYKIIKKKVRRDDNPAPIYLAYDLARNFINEVR